MRQFGRKRAFGKVSRWAAAEADDPALWHVEHEDGDAEDLDEEEVREGLEALRQLELIDLSPLRNLGSKTGYIGVNESKPGAFRARCTKDGEVHELGAYATAEQAARVVAAELQHSQPLPQAIASLSGPFGVETTKPNETVSTGMTLMAVVAPSASQSMHRPVSRGRTHCCTICSTPQSSASAKCASCLNPPKPAPPEGSYAAAAEVTLIQRPMLGPQMQKQFSTPADSSGKTFAPTAEPKQDGDVNTTTPPQELSPHPAVVPAPTVIRPAPALAIASSPQAQQTSSKRPRDPQIDDNSPPD